MPPDPQFPDSMPLGEARDILRGLVEDGHTCPLCTQHAQVYRWSLYSTAAHALILFYREGGTTEPRDDGGRSGYWRVTGRGAAFVRNEIDIPKYVLDLQQAPPARRRPADLHPHLATCKRCIASMRAFAR